ncbi:hypothetical protein NPIL_77131 [Nephila pilipes]|uniref:Uncharacterized protein n=1 Tax=Nephila pilipes TaxID=299642 RepID=A0A8X6MBX6_NEPPI|nr:hypothetical protein NPIL_77131 [Nephila pilipes]
MLGIGILKISKLNRICNNEYASGITALNAPLPSLFPYLANGYNTHHLVEHCFEPIFQRSPGQLQLPPLMRALRLKVVMFRANDPHHRCWL